MSDTTTCLTAARAWWAEQWELIWAVMDTAMRTSQTQAERDAVMESFRAAERDLAEQRDMRIAACFMGSGEDNGWEDCA